MRSSADGKIGCAAVVVVVVVIMVLVWLFNSFGSTTPAYVGLVRNGGPFDNTQLQREDNGDPVILPPASALTNVGFSSTIRLYPATPRYWTIDRDGGDTNQAITVPTLDGKEVGVAGQFIFNLNQDPKVLADFDERYGSRTFAGPDGSQVSPSDGTDEGFNAFLQAFVPNVVFNSLRQEIGSINCRDLVPSCALVQSNGQVGAPPAGNGQAAIVTIQNRVNDQFEQAVNSALGGPYLTNATFNLSGVTLDPDLQAAINRTQTEFARAGEAQAQQQRAAADSLTAAERQRGYDACSTCRELDVLRAQGEAWSRMPPNTVWAPGSGVGLTAPVR